MKKSLFTLALMSAFATPAMAGDVSIYGVLDAGVDYTKSGATSLTRMESGLAGDSRFGFKGTESLGDGVTASFVLEQGIAVDSGDSMGGSFRRQAWVGVASKELGELRLGHQHTPIYETLATLDPMSVGLAGNALNIMGMGQYKVRGNNAVTYIAPTMGGLNATVQYGLGESMDGASKDASFGFSGGLTEGSVAVMVAYNSQKANSFGADAKQTDMLLGATYDLGMVKAHAGFNESKYFDGVAGFDEKARNVLLGVSVPMGKHSVMASWIRNDVKDLDDSNTDQFALGYNYGMSKRTKLYASYAHVSNDANVAVFAGGLGEKTRKVNVGMSHSF